LLDSLLQEKIILELGFIPKIHASKVLS